MLEEVILVLDFSSALWSMLPVLFVKNNVMIDGSFNSRKEFIFSFPRKQLKSILNPITLNR